MVDELVAAGRLRRRGHPLPELAHGAVGGRRGEGLVHLAQVGVAAHVAARAEAAHAHAAVGEVVQLRPVRAKRLGLGIGIKASELRQEPTLMLPSMELSSCALGKRAGQATTKLLGLGRGDQG